MLSLAECWLLMAAEEVLVDFAARAVMLAGVRPDLVLAVLHQVDSPHAKSCSDRLMKSLSQGGEEYDFAVKCVLLSLYACCGKAAM